MAEDRVEKIPVLFVGHGSPMNAIEHNAFTESLSTLGAAPAAAQGRVRSVCALGDAGHAGAEVGASAHHP